MVWWNLFSEGPVSGITSSFSKALPSLIILMILIGIVYWIRSFQKSGRTEIKIYRRP